MSETETLDLQVFVEQKGNAVAPGHCQARYNFARGDVLADLVAFKRVFT